MREIKFRAWDKIKKRMLYRGLFDKNWYATEYNDSGGCHCVDGIKQDDKYHFEIMQYTELKDKNGKEIYEGDIIKEGVVRFNNKFLGFFVELIKNNENEFDYDHMPLYDVLMPVIIGNIYENSELLKGVEE